MYFFWEHSTNSKLIILLQLMGDIYAYESTWIYICRIFHAFFIFHFFFFWILWTRNLPRCPIANRRGRRSEETRRRNPPERRGQREEKTRINVFWCLYDKKVDYVVSFSLGWLNNKEKSMSVCKNRLKLGPALFLKRNYSRIRVHLV